MKTLSPVELARRIEHLLVRADATRRDLESLCAAARAQGAHAVCVCGSQVELARSLLEDSEVKVTGLVGFPSEPRTPTPSVTRLKWRLTTARRRLKRC